MRAVVLTLDLDGPTEYARIHGLEPPPENPSFAYGPPLSRFLSLLDDHGAKATLFAIGRDAHGENSEILAEAQKEGHEIANHSFAHDYRMSSRPAAAIRDDLRRAQETLALATGQMPRGFRAPGYLISPALLEGLRASGLAYSSSVLSSPPYFLLKLGVLASYWARRRRSVSRVGSLRALTAPRQPFQPGPNPYAAGKGSLWELPISCSGRFGFPALGAALMIVPRPIRTRVIAALNRLPVVILNLHAMDLVDPGPDPLTPALAERQPELRISLDKRLAILAESIQALRENRRSVTCAQLLDQLTEPPHPP